MPDWVQMAAHVVGSGLMVLLIVLLCVGGMVVSCVAFSGTWLVLLAALLGMITRGPNDTFPGWLTLAVFLVICVLVELGEYAAGVVGVVRRGGSKRAGWAALGGGLLGLLVGSWVPIPILGSLLGMVVGSFGLVYLVEVRRVQHEKAVDIAMGTVWARVAVIAGKVVVTVAMSFVLWVGMVFS